MTINWEEMSAEKTMKAFLERKERLDDVERNGRESTSEESYDKEFAKLREMSASYKTGNVYPTTEGEKPCNIPKNRYKDIIPFDATRVNLKTVKPDTGNDYINASFIKGAIGGQTYIAAQGPMPKTVNDFWQMIWENNVEVIFMACREYEGDPQKLKCQRYWPNSTTEEMFFGNIKVTLSKEEATKYKEHVIRHLIAKSGDEVRTLVQLHYVEWPDRGVPRCIPGILDLIEYFRDKQELNKDKTPPVLVHCSAGCGRTGTILVIDYVLSLLKYGKLASNFSIFEIIAEMRRQRMAIVQSQEQYVFVHDAVAELFKRQLELIDTHIYDNVELPGFAHSKSHVNPLPSPTEVQYAEAYASAATKKPLPSPTEVQYVEAYALPATKKPVPSPTEVQYAESFPPPPTRKLMPSPTEVQYAEPSVSSPARKNLPPKPIPTYSLAGRISNDDTSTSETSKIGEYAYANPYQPDKWSLQAIALGQKGAADYETIPDMGYSGDSRNPYSEIKPEDFHSKIGVGNHGAPIVPARKPDEVSGHPVTKEDRMPPLVNNILARLIPQRQDPSPVVNNSSQGFEIAKVIFRDVDISFPNRVGKPRGKRPIKVAQVSAFQ